MLNDVSTALSLLETRRSGRPRDMVEPGPSDAELDRMLEISARVPDHGRLVPFRFVVVDRSERPALADLYQRALLAGDPQAPEIKITKSLANAHAAPVLVVLVFAPVVDHKIPVFEQQLTCGAAGINLLHAGHALGYVGGWITGWPAEAPEVSAAFCNPGERIAGLIYFGSPAFPLEERERPDMARIVTRWSPPDVKTGG